jgi:hypothetical protein
MSIPFSTPYTLASPRGLYCLSLLKVCNNCLAIAPPMLIISQGFPYRSAA